MKKIGAVFIACFFLISATGFKFDWRNVNLIKPAGTAYQNDLGIQLRKLANEEAKERNWRAANYFANKAIDSLKGGNVKPYNPKGWVYANKVSYNELLLARKMLLNLQNSHKKEKHTHLLAKMTADFDCWGVRQQSDKYIVSALKCRESFFKIANYLNKNSFNAEYKGYIEQTSNILNKSGNYDRIYRMDLLFSWSSTSLSKNEYEKINRIVDYLNNVKGKYSVVLIGHADQTGNHSVNFSFSYERAVVVKKALVAAGVPKNKIKLYAMSKNMPIIDVQNKRKLVNRRVEVYVLDDAYISTVKLNSKF